MNKKYILTNETTKFLGHTLHRIQAVKDFGDVKAGDLGGWIESEENLSQEGTCWVYDEAKVFDEACVYGEAWVFDEAEVFDEARVFGEACVSDEAKVFDKARIYGEAWVFGEACVSDEAEVSDKAVITGTTTLRTTAYVHSQYDFLSIENIGSRNGTTTFYKTKEGGIDVACGCFRGSIEKFFEAVEKTHGDNEHGRVYKDAIEMAKRTLNSELKPDKQLKNSPNIKVLHHRRICSGLSDLYEKKNHDYGDSFHETFLEEGWAMPRIRLGDKYRRFCALTSSSEGPLVKDESVRDTLLDLANYAILTVLEMDCRLGAAESTASGATSKRPSPLPQAMVEAANIAKLFDKALSREEKEACNQTYYYINELDPEKCDQVEIKFDLPRALQKMLNILREQKVKLPLHAAKDCNQFVTEVLRNEISEGSNRHELSVASCNLLGSLILLLTDLGYTKTQILDYILDKWNRKITERTDGETNGN